MPMRRVYRLISSKLGLKTASEKPSKFMNHRKLLVGMIAAATPVFAADPTKEQLDFFEQKVRPLLANNCYSCHSIAEGKSKGGLTLDTRDGALKGGDTGKGIVPGDPSKSLIYVAMTYKDEDMQMPPTSKGGKMKPEELAVIEQWIKMGAPDPRKEAVKSEKLSGMTDKAKAHWAFQPLKHYKSIPVPKVKNAGWVRTPIDNFIMEKLDAAGILPTDPAPREMLLRRAYYDLIGMPPSPAEIDAFVMDAAPNAWEKVIDRLLASPHYGERWGRHWMDSARYADTIGGDANTNNGRNDYRYAHAWTYRDYVIRAMNEDKPYNQFVMEQLAADFMYPLRKAGESATAPGSNAGGTTGKQPLAKVDTAKADPFGLGKGAGAAKPANTPASPATPAPAMAPAMMGGDSMAMMGGDSMMGMGGGGAGGLAESFLPGHPNLAALGFLTVGERFNNNNDNIDDRINVTSKAFLGLTVSCARCHDHMFDPVSMKDYYALHGIFNSSTEPTQKPLIAPPNASQFADYETKKKAIEKENKDIYFREVEHWLGLFAAKPASYLKAVMLRRDRSETAQVERQAMIEKEQLDVVLANYWERAVGGNNRVFGPLGEYREVKKSEWDTHSPLVLKEIRLSNRYNPIVVKAFEEAKPASMEQVIGVYERLLTQYAAKMPGFVKAFQNATGDNVPGFTADEIEIMSGPFRLTTAPKATMDWIRDATGGWAVQMTGRARFVFAKMNELDLTHPGAPKRAMVMLDKDRPADSNILLRGQAGAPGDKVERRFLDILSPGHQAKPFARNSSGRMELAKAIASKENPLTGRVLVNRVWMHHFGEGFVRTPDDLGVMSEKPSHPELIDFLSSWFVDENAGNWSLKRLHKFIMLSKVYQLNSKVPAKDLAAFSVKDPENRLLWRANIRRLQFEAIRDSLLVFSGRLDPKLGGQPVNITDEPYVYRRSVYGYIDRGNVPELMGLFDFSDPDMPNSKRTATVVPQQALFVMNSPMAIDVARRVIARPEVANERQDFRKILAIYRILFQRQPGTKEIEAGMAFVAAEAKKQPEIDAMAPEIMKKNAAVRKRIEDRRARDNDGLMTIINDGDIIERKPLTAWESYAHALLFSNESAYVN
jgi:hypothetical protein